MLSIICKGMGFCRGRRETIDLVLSRGGGGGRGVGVCCARVPRPPWGGRRFAESMSDLSKPGTLPTERKGRVLHVTLNRPEARNALSHEMVRDLTTLVGADGAGSRDSGAIDDARRGRHVLRRRRHQGLHGVVQLAAAEGRREDSVALAQPPVRRVHDALRGAAADDRDGGRGCGVRRRAWLAVRRRCGAGDG